MDGLAVADEYLGDVREHDGARDGVLREQRREAVVLERLGDLVVEVGRGWQVLQDVGLRVDVWVRDLGDAVDPDLLWRRAEGEGVAIPEDDICQPSSSVQSIRRSTPSQTCIIT